MAYLVAQIFVCLLLAALLGGLVGWLLRGRHRAAAPDADALATAHRRTETLERELAACHDAHRAAPVAAAAGEGIAASAAGRVMRDAPAGSATPAGLFGTPAARPVDDLEVISGIEPLVAAHLAGIGVTTFRQIAHFTPADIERVNDAIGVSQGRIEREEWVAQAARLHAETYGTDA